MRKMCGCIFLLACGLARLDAGAYNVAAIVQGPDGLGFDLNGVHCSSIPPEVFGNSASAMASCSGITTAKSGPFNNSTFVFDGSAQAFAAAGVLGAEAVAGALNAPFDHLFHTGGGSSFAEVTSHDGFLASTNGLVSFAFTVTGGSSVTGDTFAGGSMSFSPAGGSVQGFVLNNGTTLIQTTPVSFFQGISFFYDWDLSLGVFLCNSCNAQTTPLQYTGNGIADYSHTAILTGMTITDANGHPLSGVNFTSSDGVDYNALLGGAAPGGGTPNAVPEPRALGAIAGALALLFTRRQQNSKEKKQ